MTKRQADKWRPGMALIRWTRPGTGRWYSSSIVTVKRARQLANGLTTKGGIHFVICLAKQEQPT